MDEGTLKDMLGNPTLSPVTALLVGGGSAALNPLE
jgi:hypothetical protein